MRIAPLVLFAAAAAVLRAETAFNIPAPRPDIAIQMTSPVSTMPSFGFMPVRIILENRSESDGTWRFEFHSGARNGPTGEVESALEIAAPAKQNREVWFYVPLAEPSSLAFASSPAPSSTRNRISSQVQNQFLNQTRQDLRAKGFNANPLGVPNISPRPDGTADVSMVFEEIGTPAMLPMPATGSLPPNFRAEIIPGPGPTMVRRRFVFETTMPAFALPGGAAAMPVKLVSLPIAVSPPPPNSMYAEVSGPGFDNAHRIQIQSIFGYGQNGTPPLAVSAPIEPALRTMVASMGLRGNPNLAPVDPAALPADWRVWSPFHAVILRATDYQLLDSARKAALRGWVAFGGRLLLSPDAPGGASAPVEHVGAGYVATLSLPAASLPVSVLAKELHMETLALAIPDAAKIAAYTKTSAFNQLVSGVSTPTGWLAVFLLGFAALIAPVNLFLFAPVKRRYRLFITTPLIALGGAAVLLAMILLKDGIGGSGVRTSLIALIPGENTAAVFQDQATHSGFLRARSFPLPDDAVIARVPVPSSTVVRLAAMGRNSGTATGDWFRNRAADFHHVRRLVPTRSRVTATSGAGGAPVLESTFSTPLRSLAYVHADGSIWTTASLPPGKPVTLTKASAGFWTDWPAVYLDSSEHLSQVLREVATPGPGRWLAIGDESELAPIQTLRSITWETSRVIYSGVAP